MKFFQESVLLHFVWFLILLRSASSCPLKVSQLCKCQRWIEGLQLECRDVKLEEIVAAVINSGEKVDKLKVEGIQIPALKAGSFENLVIKEINLSGCNISVVENGAFQSQSESLRSLVLANNTLEEFINITGLGNLMSLDLSGNGLSDIPNGIFQETPILRQLRLENNRICTIRRNALEETKGFLELLDLSGNCLNFVPAPNIRGSQRLMYLDLSANSIASLPNLQFMNLPVLKEVRLSHNQILGSLGPMAFMNVPNLQQLYLRNNSISVLEANRFEAFKKLQVLDLSFNRIPRIVTSSFKQMSSLRQLFLDNNAIDSVDTLAFSANHELQMISMQNNQIKTIFRNAFDSLPQMVSLLVQNNSLETIARGAFAGLQNLQTLNLRSNGIRTIEPQALSALPELTTLDLGENSLSEVPEEAFRDLKKLFWLDLCCNGITTFAKGTFKDKIRNILIHDNKLVCDDKLDWFVTYLVAKGVRIFLPEQSEVVCAGPPKLRGTRLKDVLIKKANETFHNSFRELTPGGKNVSPLPLSNIIPALKAMPGLGGGITGLTDAVPGLSGILSATPGIDGLKSVTDPIFNGIAQGAQVNGLKGAVENFAEPLANFASGSVSNTGELSRFVGSIPGLISQIPAGSADSIPGLPGIKLSDIPPQMLERVLNGQGIPGIPQPLLDNMVRGYMTKMAQAAANAAAGKETTLGLPTSTFLPPLESLPASLMSTVLQGKALPGLTTTETSTIKDYYLSKLTEPVAEVTTKKPDNNDDGAISGETQVARPSIPRLVSAADLLGHLPKNFDLTVLPQSLLQQLASGKKVDLASIPKEVIENIRKMAPDLVARLEGSVPAPVYQFSAPSGAGTQSRPEPTNFLDSLPPPRKTISPEETFKPYDLESLDRQNEIGDPAKQGQDNIPVYTALGLAAVGVVSAGVVGYLCYRKKLSAAQSAEDLDRTKFFATSSPKTSFDSLSGATNTHMPSFATSQGTVGPYDPYGRPKPSWVYSNGGLPDFRRTEMATFQS